MYSPRNFSLWIILEHIHKLKFQNMKVVQQKKNSAEITQKVHVTVQHVCRSFFDQDMITSTVNQTVQQPDNFHFFCQPE